jgi:CRISPR-associated protein Cmr4
MFQATRMLFIYVETPLHAGIGRGLGTVDLPIQRERTTGYPTVHASGLKGCLRAQAKATSKLTGEEHLAIFGPETDKASEYAGALSTGDARLLLFPVRSLAGVFAWCTSVDALARFRREAEMVGLDLTWEKQPPLWTDLPPLEKDSDAVWVNGDALKAGDSVVLEEFSFTPKPEQAAAVRQIGEWLAANALPQTDEYKYWREMLPNKLCVLPEDAFRDFALYATEVQTHVRLDPVKKTVETGALWTAESLPVDTLLYAPLMATGSRTKDANLDAKGVLQKLADAQLHRVQLGGDETTGQGVVALCMSGGDQ